jgi:hypothetical protein
MKEPAGTILSDRFAPDEFMQGPGQLRQRVYSKSGMFSLWKQGVDMAPWSPPEKHGGHAGREGGQNVVVEAVTDVSNLAGWEASRLADPSEKSRGRFFDTPSLGRGDKVGGRATLGQGRFGRDRLIAGKTDPKASGAQTGEALESVGIEVAWLKPIAPSFSLAPCLLGGDIKTWTDEFEDPPMRLTTRDHGAQDRKKSETGHTQPVRPFPPMARLVDQGFPNIENDGTNHRLIGDQSEQQAVEEHAG